jgi:predicted  nucleic acid-binding Zn-ribbon protein
MSKISKEELESLLESEKKISAIKHDLGTLSEQKHSLLHALGQVREEQNKVKQELEDKYGKININLQDGSYEEIVEEAEEVKE